MVDRIERNKDLIQELVESTATHVGQIATIITSAVADVAREIGEIVTDGFEMREAAQRAKRTRRTTSSTPNSPTTTTRVLSMPRTLSTLPRSRSRQRRTESRSTSKGRSSAGGAAGSRRVRSGLRCR